MNRMPTLTVRFTRAEIRVIEALAASRGCSRSEAVRIAIRLGAPLAKDGFSINFTRVAEVLEQVGAGLALIIKRDHPDFAEMIDRLTDERLGQYHA